MLRACLLLPTAIALPIQPAIQPDGVAGKTLELVSFAEGAKNAYTWTDLNDPVMGGQSSSTWTIDTKVHKTAVWDGEVRARSLSLPAFRVCFVRRGAR